MRLWHTDLISVLPKEQLVGQWRELSAIAGSIKQKGTPNHLLVNFVMDYDLDHFINYARMIRAEMTKRGYRTANSVWEKIASLKEDYTLIKDKEVYPDIMNSQYLSICYENLLEKFIRGGISEEDMNNIEEVFKEAFEVNM
jgi:uncharacterized protein (TIGR02328 family)